MVTTQLNGQPTDSASHPSWVAAIPPGRTPGRRANSLRCWCRCYRRQAGSLLPETVSAVPRPSRMA
jgi:hypothetical protein